MQLAGVRPTVVWIFFGWTLRTTMLRIKYESVRVLGFSALNLTKAIQRGRISHRYYRYEKPSHKMP